MKWVVLGHQHSVAPRYGAALRWDRKCKAGQQRGNAAMAQSHLFIIDGDITQLQCDAWLLPTDSNYSITKAFAPVLGMAEEGKAPAEYRRANQP